MEYPTIEDSEQQSNTMLLSEESKRIDREIELELEFEKIVNKVESDRQKANANAKVELQPLIEKKSNNDLANFVIPWNTLSTSRTAPFGLAENTTISINQSTSNVMTLNQNTLTTSNVMTPLPNTQASKSAFMPIAPMTTSPASNLTPLTTPLAPKLPVNIQSTPLPTPAPTKLEQVAIVNGTFQLIKYNIDEAIMKFMRYSLASIIERHSNVKFLNSSSVYSYKMVYGTLELRHDIARSQYTSNEIRNLHDEYEKVELHSISSAEKDIVLYTYSPQDLCAFLRQNAHLKYTYLPLTVHAIDSANGIRHDMLLIFDNRNKLAYWFDGNNIQGYMQHSDMLPKNVMDILFITLFQKINLGYQYEPSQSWMTEGTLHPYGSIGNLDFIFSTALCYNVVCSLHNFDNPTLYLTALDDMPPANRFHVMYQGMMNMMFKNSTYANTVDPYSTVNLVRKSFNEVVKSDSTKPMVPLSSRSTLVKTSIGGYVAVPTLPTPPNATPPTATSTATSTTSTTPITTVDKKESDSTLRNRFTKTDTPAMTPMKVVTSVEKKKEDDKNCIMQ